MVVTDVRTLFPKFDRHVLADQAPLTTLGSGELGGKAKGLGFIRQILHDACPNGTFDGVRVAVPRLAVLATNVFEQFMRRNNLYEVALGGDPDDVIAQAFQRADLPPTIVGDLRTLCDDLDTPLAVRSSSLLEDALCHPFAGTYATKMIPHNHPSRQVRFQKLIEAIKFVYASTFFADAKRYMRAVRRDPADERMAVIIQQVVGREVDHRFSPAISGVARSFNFYPRGKAKPEQGVVELAYGLGKTIVDGGAVWSYCPAFPRARPPFASPRDMVDATQTKFYAIDLSHNIPHNPVAEDEYLVRRDLEAAERDGAFKFCASTFLSDSERFSPGIGASGPRVIDFAPVLDLVDLPLNALIKHLLDAATAATGGDVEIEFAVNIDPTRGNTVEFGFLQLRPTAGVGEEVHVTEDELEHPFALVATDEVMGNGVLEDIRDVVYVRPDEFNPAASRRIADQIGKMNLELADRRTPYVLIGFGRWGSSDPWLGIPVTWPQISGARVIVEATLPELHVDASQGSHFFHNLSSFGVQYLTVRHLADHRLDFDYLDRMPAMFETEFVRHVRLPQALDVRVDGRRRRGVVVRGI